MSRKRRKGGGRAADRSLEPQAPARGPLRLPTVPWRAAHVLAALLGLALYVDDFLFVRGNPLFLDHAGALLLTAADGYHYLALAAEAKLSGAPALSLPGLAALGLVLSRLLAADLVQVAFFLPPALSLLLGPAVTLLARGLGLSRGAALLAALLACAAPYWHARAGLGYFDTDCLIVPLALLAGLGLLRFAEGSGPRRWAWLGGLAAGLGLLLWWWGPVAGAVAGGFAGAYAASLFLPSTRAERRTKLGLLAAGAALLAGFLLRDVLPLPGTLASAFSFVASHLELVAHDQTGPVQVAGTIGELKALGLADLGQVTAGAAWVLSPALAGMALLAARQWRRMLLLAPILALGLGALASVRFAIFLSPLLGLGLGALADFGWGAALRLGPRAGAARAAVVLAGLALAVPAVRQAITTKFPPPFTAQETSLAAALGREAAARGESGAVVWLWWDYGYLVRYYAGLEPLFHGGSQDPGASFRAALPLAAADPSLAAAWMRALAREGEESMTALDHRFGGRTGAMDFLAKVLTVPADFPALAAAAGLPREFWQARLFPGTPVYLYLPLPMLDRLPVLWRFAAEGRGAAPDGAPEFLVQPRGAVQVDESRGLALAGGRELPLALAVHVLPEGVGLRPYGRPGRVLVDVHFLPRLYLLQEDYAGSLLFRLLFTAPQGTAHFRSVAYNSRVGGVWRVE